MFWCGFIGFCGSNVAVYKIMCKIIPMFCKVKNLCGLFYNWLTEVVLARKCIVRLLDVVTLEQK